MAGAPLPSTPERIQSRIERGQKFNGYRSTRPGEYQVGIGPISDFLSLAITRQPDVADYLVDALRGFAGQEPAQSRFFGETEDEDDE